jgi:hypothetical protein
VGDDLRNELGVDYRSLEVAKVARGAKEMSIFPPDSRCWHAWPKKVVMPRNLRLALPL